MTEFTGVMISRDTEAAYEQLGQFLIGRVPTEALEPIAALLAQAGVPTDE